MNEDLPRPQTAFDDLVTGILARFASSTGSEINAHIRTSLREIAEFIGVDYAFVIRTSADLATWSVTHEWCAPGAASQMQNFQNVTMGTFDWTERALLSGQSVNLNQLADVPDEAAASRERIRSLGFQSTLQLPMRGPGGRVNGCIALSSLSREVTWAAADEKRLRLVGEAVANVLERRRAERELQESEARYRTTFEQAPVGILNVALDGTLLRANQRFCELLGYSYEELVGKHFSEFTHPDDLQATAVLYERLLVDRRSIQSLEKRYMGKDGREIWGHLTLSLLLDDAGDPQAFVATIEDVTARKQAEELLRSEAALRRSHDTLQQRRALMVAASLDGMWEWEAATDQVLYSDRFAELLGYAATEIPQTMDFFRSILHPDDAPPLWTAIDRHLRERLPYDVECRLRTKSGRYRWFRTRGRVQRDPQGNPVWMAGALQDIHEQKTAEIDLRKALEEVERLSNQLRAENIYLQQEITSALGFDEIVGESQLLRNALTQVEHVAGTSASVLLLGETGTGKELLARAIHDRSPRKERPLVKVNLAALPSSLIESELFGHVKGAFTGAVSDKVGRFQLADGGTLFLDEIGELDADLQTKLLRVLQEGEFERLGSAETLRVDVRVVAATNRNLHRAMEEQKFRPDLYYRLAVFPIEVPPLRLRRDDIPLLVWHLITKKQARLGKIIRNVPPSVMQALIDYDWPGNIRELENVIERAMILSSGTTLNLPEPLRPVRQVPRSVVPTNRAKTDRARILAVLEACRWKIKGSGNAADRLGLNPSTLRYRMKILGIARPNG
jgi:formate hydrogenlyase transcriptional activator